MAKYDELPVYKASYDLLLGIFLCLLNSEILGEIYQHRLKSDSAG